MFWQVFGQLLSLEVGAAVSPIAIAAVIVLLFEKNGRRNAAIFAAVTMVFLLVVTVVIAAAGRGADVDADSTARRGIAVLPLLIGLLFAYLSISSFRSRPRAGKPAETPKWMRALIGIGPARAAGVGALISLTNIKNISLSVSAGTAISTGRLSASDTVILIAVFVLIGSAGVLVPLVFVAVRGDKAAAGTLATWRGFLVNHNAIILTILFGQLAASNLGSGLGGLLG